MVWRLNAQVHAYATHNIHAAVQNALTFINKLSEINEV